MGKSSITQAIKASCIFPLTNCLRPYSYVYCHNLDLFESKNIYIYMCVCVYIHIFAAFNAVASALASSKSDTCCYVNDIFLKGNHDENVSLFFFIIFW